MENPENLLYTKEHEWVRIEGDIATVGITDFAQHSLTDIVFVELPQIGRQAEQFKSVAVVESVKSVSDIFSPLSGEVVEVNTALPQKPELVNRDPYGEGWIFRIKISNPEEKNSLLAKQQYEQLLKSGEH